ncbi:hydroxysqualene dehydroxylase [Mycobacterium sp. LTG2003]
MTTVAVLGGGVGGLTAAHELCDRGFDVTVYESRREFGGKARSMPVPGSAVGNRKPLPAEHGFRFFPGFYRHIPDTMARIPHGNKTVDKHLAVATEMLLAQDGGANEIVTSTQPPTSLDDLRAIVKVFWEVGFKLGVSPPELVWFVQRLLTMMTSCDERRFGQWEQMSWWEFIGAAQRSEAFQKFLAEGMTRTLVAAKATEMSARTGGVILCQLLFDLARADGRLDRVLDGPTSEVWIDPWTAHLAGNGVVFRSECPVAGIDCDGTRITGVTVTANGGPEHVVADYYISALPKERLELLLSPALQSAEPRLAGLPRLKTDWMNGAMFYLDRDVRVVHGHAIFIDSAWSLTAISQAQFWHGINLTQRGDGRVEGILSVDISAWDKPGGNGMVAAACSKDQILEEVWHQLVEHIDDGSLDKDNVITSFLDPAITFPNPTKATNLEPLLINIAGSWADRPDAVTAIPNFFLAADFVRTYTDLATMEAANEAARRAVNGILDATDSSARRCEVWPLREQSVLKPLRRLDRVRWLLRQPAKPPIEVKPGGELEPTSISARGLLAAARLFGRRP